MDATTLTAYLVSVSSFTAILVQFLKGSLIDPHMAEGSARDTAIRLLSIVLNTLGLCAVLATHGQFDPTQLLTYAAFVAMQATGSHVLYSVASQPASPKQESGI